MPGYARLAVTVAVLAGCGRIGYDATSAGGDGAVAAMDAAPATDAAAAMDAATMDAAAAMDAPPRPDGPDTAPATAGCGPTLLVVADRDSDTPPLQRRLAGLGCGVTLRLDTEVQPGDGAGVSLIVIAESVRSPIVGPALRTSAVPMVVMEAFLYDDMGLTGAVEQGDYGEAPQTRTIEIVRPAHPLAGGLAGTVTLLPSAATCLWGRPSSAGLVIATVAARDERAVVFAYEPGAAMVGMAAPARRVGYAPVQGGVAPLSEDAWRLFDAAVRWAVAAP